MSETSERRFLHHTMKVTDRAATRHFYCDILGMKLLRHEENDSGCPAQCNGNFQSPWSKTMVGYGDEHSYFCFELNFNYDVKGYVYGDDYSSVRIRNRQAVSNASSSIDKTSQDISEDGHLIVRSPDGHKFVLVDEDVLPGEDPVQELSMNVSDLSKSIDYYTRLLKMAIVEQDEKHVRLCYGTTTKSHLGGTEARTKSGFKVDNQCQLELVGVNRPLMMGTGYGRMAFGCSLEDIPVIQKTIEQEGYNVKIPQIKLGGLFDMSKVTVVILSDPDQHEVAFVAEENYSKYSKTSDSADKDLAKALVKEEKHKTDEKTSYAPGEDEATRAADPEKKR